MAGKGPGGGTLAGATFRHAVGPRVRTHAPGKGGTAEGSSECGVWR